MSFFSRLLGSRQSSIERQLWDVHVLFLLTFGACSREEAEKAASDAIATCKQQGKAQGTSDLPENFGELIIAAAHMGEPKSKRIVEKAGNEGATNFDIKEWWNLPDLCRRMVILREDTIRHAVFLHAMGQDGLSAKDAALRVRTMYPIYGDPDDTSKLSGDDRPIAHELRGRVDSYKQVHSASYIADQVQSFSSYNAVVRHAVRTGVI